MISEMILICPGDDKLFMTDGTNRRYCQYTLHSSWSFKVWPEWLLFTVTCLYTRLLKVLFKVFVKVLPECLYENVMFSSVFCNWKVP